MWSQQRTTLRAGAGLIWNCLGGLEHDSYNASYGFPSYSYEGLGLGEKLAKKRF